MNDAQDQTQASHPSEDRGGRPLIRSKGLRWAIVLTVLGGIGVALYWGIQRVREAAITSASECPLGQLQLALLDYHQRYGCFPPAYIADENGRPMHSWRVLILPSIEEQELYDEYDFDEPWDGPHNIKLADRMPPIFHCPSEPASSSFTNFVVIVGPHTAFPGTKSTRLRDFSDGPGSTILVAEIADSDIPWTAPRDLNVDEMSFSVNDPSKPSISSARRSGPLVGLADSTHPYFIGPSLRAQTLRALTTIDAGDTICMVDRPLTTLTEAPATDADLAEIDRWDEVRRLWLNGAATTDAGLVHVAAAQKLLELHLSGTNITDAGLGHLKEMTSLDHLILSGTRITDAGLKHLEGLGELDYLDVRNTEVTIPGVLTLAESHRGLTVELSEGRVGISWGTPEGGVVDADPRQHEAQVIKRASITLSWANDPGKWLTAFAQVPAVRSLDLSRTGVEDADLNRVAGFSDLEELMLGETRVTDAGLKHLRGLTNLRDLSLARTQVTDRGLEQLAEMLELEFLDLSQTGATDKGLERLTALKKLSWIDLTGTRVSETGVDQLKEALPALTVWQ